MLGRVVVSGEEQDTRRELVERAAIIGSRVDEYLRAHDLAAASLALRIGAAPVTDAEAERDAGVGAAASTATSTRSCCSIAPATPASAPAS